MERQIAELSEIGKNLVEIATEVDDSSIATTLNTLEMNANRVGQAWSGSWIGYHSLVYFRNFERPPTGTYFDKEFGLGHFSSSDRNWLEFSIDQVREKIKEGLSQESLKHVVKTCDMCKKAFDKNKFSIHSIFQTLDSSNGDSILDQLGSRVNQLSEFSQSNRTRAPSQSITRDSIAMQQGIWMPPHIEALIFVESTQFYLSRVHKLIEIVEQAISHLKRANVAARTTQVSNDRVFIGHGQTFDWYALQNFLEKDLKLKVDEFNRVPIGGVSTKERLQQMLCSSCFAFLVLTADDEIAVNDSAHEQDKIRKQARMNVIHEAGLFQGKLGFEYAIILLENGCEEFSNIHGVGQIRFDKGKLSSTFHEVRRHLEDRGILPKPA